MSNATTQAQALSEFTEDLKRLATGKTNARDAYLALLEQSAQDLATTAQGMRQKIAISAQVFLESKRAEVDAHVEADLAAAGLSITARAQVAPDEIKGS